MALSSYSKYAYNRLYLWGIPLVKTMAFTREIPISATISDSAFNLTSFPRLNNSFLDLPSESQTVVVSLFDDTFPREIKLLQQKLIRKITRPRQYFKLQDCKKLKASKDTEDQFISSIIGEFWAKIAGKELVRSQPGKIVAEGDFVDNLYSSSPVVSYIERRLKDSDRESKHRGRTIPDSLVFESIDDKQTQIVCAAEFTALENFLYLPQKQKQVHHYKSGIVIDDLLAGEKNQDWLVELGNRINERWPQLPPVLCFRKDGYTPLLYTPTPIDPDYQDWDSKGVVQLPISGRQFHHFARSFFYDSIEQIEPHIRQVEWYSDYLEWIKFKQFSN